MAKRLEKTVNKPTAQHLENTKDKPFKIAIETPLANNFEKNSTNHAYYITSKRIFIEKLILKGN